MSCWGVRRWRSPPCCCCAGPGGAWVLGDGAEDGPGAMDVTGCSVDVDARGDEEPSSPLRNQYAPPPRTAMAANAPPPQYSRRERPPDPANCRAGAVNVAVR